MKITLKYILISAVVILVCGTCIYAVKEVRNQQNDYRNQFYRHYRIYSPEIPDKMDFDLQVKDFLQSLHKYLVILFLVPFLMIWFEPQYGQFDILEYSSKILYVDLIQVINSFFWLVFKLSILDLIPSIFMYIYFNYRYIRYKNRWGYGNINYFYLIYRFEELEDFHDGASMN